MFKALSAFFILRSIFLMDISGVGKGLYISNTNKATTCSTGKGLWVHGIALGDNEELGYSPFSDVPSPSLLPYFDLLTLHRSRWQWPLSPPYYELLDKRLIFLGMEKGRAYWGSLASTGEPLLSARHQHSFTTTTYLKLTGVTREEGKILRTQCK